MFMFVGITDVKATGFHLKQVSNVNLLEHWIYASLLLTDVITAVNANRYYTS